MCSLFFKMKREFILYLMLLLEGGAGTIQCEQRLNASSCQAVPVIPNLVQRHAVMHHPSSHRIDP